MKSLKQIKKIKSYKKRQKALKERASEIMQRYSWEHLSRLEWETVRSQGDWSKSKEKALEDYFSGVFLVNMMGGVRNNRPSLIAVLLYLRRAWIDEYRIMTVPEFLILDFALVNYYRFLRANWIIGNFERVAEFDFYGEENPKLKTDRLFKVTGFSAEDHIQKMIDSLQPSLERFNRMFLRNLKALRDLKKAEGILNITNIGQMNVGEKQVNIGKADAS